MLVGWHLREEDHYERAEPHRRECRTREDPKERKPFPLAGPGELHLPEVTQTTLGGISETSFYSRGNGDSKLASEAQYALRASWIFVCCLQCCGCNPGP